MSGAEFRTALLSAHRGGCGRSKEVENTLSAFLHAVKMAVEFVEFDVQRSRDGVFFIEHEDRVRTPSGYRPVSSLTIDEIEHFTGPRLRYEAVLALLSEHGRKAHLDFKFVSPPSLYRSPETAWEVDAVRMARTHLADDAFIVTTAEDCSVRVVRDWADAEGLSLVVGLSIGRHRLTGMGWWRKICWRVREPFPAARIRDCRANLVVAQRHLARWRILSWAGRHGIPVLVWTVDGEKEMARLLRDRRVWMITSNYPERGIALRAAHSQSQ